MASRLLPRSPIRNPSRLLFLRHRSVGPDELSDLAESVQRLEDAMHDIDVKRAAPSWLPFLPGSSYWVPPRSRRVDADRVVRLVGKIGDPTVRRRGTSVGSGDAHLLPGQAGIDLLHVPPHPFEESLPDRGSIKSDDDEA